MDNKTYPKTTVAIVAISVLLAQLTFAAPRRYEIIDLGTLTGRYRSSAKSINDRGDIVGSAHSCGWSRVVLFDSSGRGNNIDLGTLGGNWSLGPSINNNWKIVGYSQNDSGFWRATLFHPSGVAIENIDLGALGGTHSFSHSINNAGQIVGSAENSSGYERATLFDPTGHRNNIELGTLGGLESKAFSINDSGQIVGRAEIKPTSIVDHATLFDLTGSGANIDLGTLGGNQSSAFSINDSGQIIGKSRNSSGYQRATLFDPSGAGDNTDLGTLGGDWSSAEWINDKGQIVGTAAIASQDRRATLFDPTGDGKNIDLNTLIDPDCGWTLEWAGCINNNGSIVGGGYNPAGYYRAFLMMPVPRTIYVDDNALGNNDGSSWADAFNYLQDALTAAWSGDEIHVAEGTYKPDQGAGITLGDREATFQLINGVILKGGYAGEGTPDPNARDIKLYETILSGDSNGNDVEVTNPVDLWSEPTRADNTNVFWNGVCDETAVLDGFTITGGRGDFGGGMINYNSDPTIINCTFSANTAGYDGYEGGGAIYNYYSNPTLINCEFIGNSAGDWCGGGGMYNDYSNPTLINCTFIGNTAEYYGGGMINFWSNPILTDCTFTDNFSPYRGGGIHNDSGSFSPMLTNCTFTGNSAACGGGMYGSRTNSPILTNCTFSGNTAEECGGAICNGESGDGGGSPTLNNCVFTGNRAGEDGGALHNGPHSSIILTKCTFSDNSASNGNALACNSLYQRHPSDLQVTNCIFWDGGNEIWNNDGSIIIITYSDVQGGWSGEGNIDADPCFVELGYWDANGVWIDGDYHLLQGSPCIDAGDPNYIAEPNETDLDGNPRVIGGRIDMGAYEYSPPIPAEVRIVPRTINLTSMGKWITCYISLPEDYNVADIDPKSVFLEDEVQAESLKVDEEQQVATARFTREDVQTILEVGDINLTITGRLTDGDVFEATDVIRVLNKASQKSPE